MRMCMRYPSWSILLLFLGTVLVIVTAGSSCNSTRPVVTFREHFGDSDFVNSRRIIGGHVVPSDKYPWAAFFSRLAGGGQVCAGTLIDKRWVMTACHCILGSGNNGYRPAGKRGDTQFLIKCPDYHNRGSEGCIKLDVKRFVHHPCYITSCCDDHDDMCLAELYEDAPVEQHEIAKLDGVHGTVPPLMKVYNGGTPDPGQQVLLMGWGYADTAGIQSQMRVVELRLASQDECKAQEPKAVRENLITFDNIVCTGGIEGKDSCGGDSGGPAAVEYNGEVYVIGVLVKGTEEPSSSFKCGIQGRYGVYTAVAKYHDFIKTQITGGEYQCPNCFTGSVRTSCTSDPPLLNIPIEESSHGNVTSLSIELSFSNLELRNWWGDVQRVYETGFAISLKLYNETSKEVHPHCVVGSRPTARRSLTVSFMANISNAIVLATAREYSKGLTRLVLAESITKANQILGTSVLAPTENEISTQGFAASSDSDDDATVIVASVIAAVVVVILCAGAAFYMTRKRMPERAGKEQGASVVVPVHTRSGESETQSLSKLQDSGGRAVE